MSTHAYVFPGQGSQYVGMGRDLVSHDPRARALFARADAVLEAPLSAVCFTGPEEELRRTANTQPAIFVHSLAVAVLLDGVPAMMAGHSLGEYSALTAAGVLDFDDALRLVRLRGELMQECGEQRPGTMAAVVGLEDEAVDDLCGAARAEGAVVQAANFNAPGQVVISGSVDGVRAAMHLARECGARLVKELNVSGAFHSPLMAPAAARLGAAIDAAPFHDARVPVYANVTAAPVRDAGEIRDLLVRQLTSPVRWTETVRRMAGDGATTFIEIGPGSVLQGLVKRIVPAAAVRGVNTWEDVTR